MDMETKRFENNQATLSGEIVSNFEFSHKTFGEIFHTAYLSAQRLSETDDIIPIMVSERLVDVKSDWIGQFVKISGQFRSYNKHEDKKNRLVLSVFVREFEFLENPSHFAVKPNDENEIFLDGYICKQPIYRKTPLGREVADILLAINRPYGKSDYIPCIAWGRNARFASGLEVGARLKVWGRIQSREYQKRLPDGDVETRIAYEVSISKMEVPEDEQGKD